MALVIVLLSLFIVVGAVARFRWAMGRRDRGCSAAGGGGGTPPTPPADEEEQSPCVFSPPRCQQGGGGTVGGGVDDEFRAPRRMGVRRGLALVTGVFIVVINPLVG